MASQPILEMIGICKYFPGVKANDHISIEIQPGEVYGLLGENGAGKSTLMNVLFGLYKPDAGEIRINGQTVQDMSPRKAIDHYGIQMVHQHFMLVETLTVAENIVLGSEPSKMGYLDRQEIHRKVQDLIDRIGFDVDLNAYIEDLSVGQQQRVEILKTLYRDAKILILDEPTAVLTPSEVEEFFDSIRRLNKEYGLTVIFITHKLREIMAITDRVSVLRQGTLVGTEETAKTTPPDLARMMVGREVLFELEREPVEVCDVVLQCENLSVIDDRGLVALDDVSLQVCKGEIVGIAGVQGNGQGALVEAITGLSPVNSGKVFIGGEETTNFTPKEVADRSVAHIPDDRQRRGLIMTFSVNENLILGLQDYPQFQNYFFLQRDAIEDFAEKARKRFEIKLTSLDAPVSTMSGGNQQKVILGRELLGKKPKLVVASQPTRGLDVGVIQYVHQTLLEMREEAGIMLVSTELDEIRALADRAYVLFRGKIMAEVNPRTISDQDISLLMAGIDPNTEAN
ncbi:MAG: ABC transporter ATP-binding protein [Candidatus Hodarchaeota archaeon]